MNAHQRHVGRPRGSTSASSTSEKAVLDTIDRRILMEKEANPFASARELAKSVGMTPSPVIERLRWLREHGYINENRASVVNPQKVGFDIEVLMDITLTSTQERENVLGELRAIPYVRRCWFITGNSDFVAQIFARNIDDLKLIITRISEIPGILRTRTNIALDRPINNSKLPLNELPEFKEARKGSQRRKRVKQAKRKA